MDERVWGRLAAVCGLGSSVLLLVRTVIVPPNPFANGPGAVTKFFVDHGGVLRFGVFLTGVIVVLGTFFFGGLRAYLSRRGSPTLANIAFGGWLIQGALALVRNSLTALPALMPQISSIAVIFYGFSSIMLGYMWFCTFVIAGAVGLMPSSSKALPAWFTWLTLFMAIVFLAGGLAVSTQAGFFSRAGSFRSVVLYGYIGWVAVASLVLWMRVRAEPA